MSKKKKTNEICITHDQLEKLYNAVIELESDNIEVEDIFITKIDEKIEASIAYFYTEHDVKEITL